MTYGRAVGLGTCLWLFMLAVHPALAADLPAPKEGDWVARDFRFHTGEVLPRAAPALHDDRCADRRAGAGAARHRGLGREHARAGLRRRAVRPGPAAGRQPLLRDPSGRDRPRQVEQALRRPAREVSRATTTTTWSQAQYRLLTEHLGVKHLRLVIGNSMGGMEAWIWATKYPDFMDIAVPMASLPTEMSSRNWMMRRLITTRSATIRSGWTATTRSSRAACSSPPCSTASPPSAATTRCHAAAPTREKADALLDQRLAAPFPADANDVLYQWESSRDYNPSPGLERIQASPARDQLRRRRAQPARAGHARTRDQAREERPLRADPRPARRRAATAPPAWRSSGRSTSPSSSAPPRSASVRARPRWSGAEEAGPGDDA